jgi:hypothetical protein
MAIVRCDNLSLERYVHCVYMLMNALVNMNVKC